MPMVMGVLFGAADPAAELAEGVELQAASVVTATVATAARAGRAGMAGRAGRAGIRRCPGRRCLFMR
jgi:hypothetical protein